MLHQEIKLFRSIDGLKQADAVWILGLEGGERRPRVSYLGGVVVLIAANLDKELKVAHRLGFKELTHDRGNVLETLLFPGFAELCECRSISAAKGRSVPRAVANNCCARMHWVKQ